MARERLPDKWAVRTVERFILFPLTLPLREDGGPFERRWMERAKIVQSYEPYQHRIGASCFWEDVHWYCKGE